MKKPMSISFTDIVILAEYICDVPDGLTDQEIEETLIDKFGYDLEGFSKIVEVLAPMANKAKSPLTKTLYQGFEVKGHWLLKIPV